MPQPHTGELVPSGQQLWTFDSNGNLVVAGGLYTGGVPDPAKAGPGQPLVPGNAVAASFPGGGGTVDWINVKAAPYKAAGNGLADDTAAIQAALNAAAKGQVVYLPTGTYVTSAPVIVPPAVVLKGSSGNTLSLSDYGSIIRPSSSWAQGGAAGAGVILLLSQTAGGYSSVSEEQKLFDFMIDGSNLTGTVDGILAVGNVGSITIQRVNVTRVTGTGLHGISDSGSNPTGPVWYVEQLQIHQAGTNGINIAATDCDWRHCYVIGSGQKSPSDGWVISSTSSNSNWTACRSEDSIGGNGFSYTCQNKSGNGVTFTGCSTQGNDKNGFFITSNANAAPVNLTGFRSNDDGPNGGSGGGSYAGIAITSYPSIVQLSGCMSVPGTAQSVNAPQYGLSVTSNTGGYVQVTNSIIWGYTTALSNDGTATLVTFDAACTFMTGPGTGPAITAPATKLIAASSAIPVPTVTEELSGARTGAKGATIPRWNCTQNVVATTSGTVACRMIILPAGIPVANITMMAGTTAKTGGTHGWYVLLDSTMHVLAVSADQTDAATTWGTVNTEQTLAVPGSGGTIYVTTYSGVYYTGVMVANSAGTQPNFVGGPNFQTNMAAQVPALGGTSSAGQTTAPAIGATLANISGTAASNYYAYVS